MKKQKPWMNDSASSIDNPCKKVEKLEELLFDKIKKYSDKEYYKNGTISFCHIDGWESIEEDLKQEVIEEVF